MNKLFETVDKLKIFTKDTVKEELALSRSTNGTIESILIRYVFENEMIEIPISEVCFFNVTTHEGKTYGYIVLKNNKVNMDYTLENNDITSIIVNFDDKSSDIFFIEWSSLFKRVGENTYSVIFGGEETSLADVLKD